MCERSVVTIRWIVALLVDQRIDASEASQHVDVTVGVVAFEFARAQPKYTLGAQVFAKYTLHLRRRDRAVAIRSQQALRGGQDRSGAVAVDGAAFQYPVHGLPGRGSECARRVPVRHQAVVIRAGKLAAPAVESKIEQARGLVRLQYRQRAMVARPHIVGVGDQKRDAIALT